MVKKDTKALGETIVSSLTAPKDVVGSDSLDCSDPSSPIHTEKENVHSQTESVLHPKLTESHEQVEHPLVSTRIYLLRHLPRKPFEDEPKEKEYQRLMHIYRTEGLKGLSEGDRGKLEKLDDESGVIQTVGNIDPKVLQVYDALFQQGSMIEIYFDHEGKRRNRETVEMIQNRYSIPPDVLRGNVHMKGSDKTVYFLKRNYHNAQELCAVLDQIKDEADKYEGKMIVLIGNRAYAEHFMKLSDSRSFSNQEAEDLFTQQGYLQIDMKRDHEGNLVPCSPDHTLIVTPENYEEIQKLFPNIPHTNLLDFQNKIQQHLHSLDTDTYRLLLSQFLKTDTEELRCFALRSLLQHGYDDAIRSFILKCKTQKEIIPPSLLTILIAQKETNLWRKALLNSLVSFPTEERVQYCTTIGLDEDSYKDFIALTGQVEKQNKESDYIFTRSLDPLVQQKEQLLERHLFYWKKEMVKKKDENGKETEREEYVQKNTNLDQMLSSQKRVVVLANVGEGKSTQLAMWKDEIENNPAYHNHIPMFYTAGSFKEKQDVKAQIEEDIERIKHMFPHKQIILFIDGIDEFVPEAKQTLREQFLSSAPFGLRNDDNVIYGSRKAGFDEHGEDGKYTALHFDTLKQSQIDEYLDQRLKSLGIPTDQITEHKKHIQEFLQQGMLEEDLKQTPLILYFLCQLSLSNENKSLEQIHNRAELYEEIVKKLLKDHQKKKKLEWSNNMTQILMKTLSDCAYQSFKGEEISEEMIWEQMIWEQMKHYEPELDEQEKQDYVEQIFLLYKNVGGQYQFILKSFQKYFLAQYLAENPEMQQPSKLHEGFTKGDEEIFQVRDTNENNWNEWRNFKPVILFYGQVMGKDLVTDTQKTHLNRFLGVDETGAIDMDLGLLKNDDGFGENFFTSYQMLCDLPEERPEEKGRMKIAYKEHVKTWDIKNVIPKMKKIADLSTKFKEEDNDILDSVIDELEKHKLYNLISKIVSTKGIQISLQLAQKLISTGEWYFYEVLARSGNEKGVLATIEGAKQLMNIGKWNEAMWMYEALVHSGNEKGVLAAIEGAKQLINWEEWYNATTVYEVLAHSGDEKGILAAIEGAKQLIDMKEWDDARSVYEVLAHSGDEKGIKGVIKGSQYLIYKYKKNWMEALEIYSILYPLNKKITF